MTLQSKYGYCITTYSIDIALYRTVYVSVTNLNKQTDNQITRCPWWTFQAGGIKKKRHAKHIIHMCKYIENGCLTTRGPKGHISCTWVQCATFLRNQPGQPSCFSDQPDKYKLGRGCWDLASYQVSLNSVQPFQKRSRQCLSQSEARAAILLFRSARKTQTW